MIQVNNRARVEWRAGLTVAKLLDELRYTFPLIIVTVDGDLVPREDYASCVIADEADVRVIHLTAGG